MTAAPVAGRRAVLQLAFQNICRQRAVVIAEAARLMADSGAAADRMDFGRATTLALSASALRPQLAALTEQIDNLQAELDEAELEAA